MNVLDLASFFRSVRISMAIVLVISIVSVDWAQGQTKGGSTKPVRSRKQLYDRDTYYRSSQAQNLKSRIDVSDRAWGSSVQYLVNSNASEPVAEKKYSHSVSGNLAYRFSEAYSFSGQVALNYYSIDRTIVKDDNNPAWDDITLSLSQKLLTNDKIKFSHTVSSILPASYDSQYEGILGMLGYALNLGHEFKVLKFTHTGTINYIQHSFEYSPTTNAKNSAWTGGYVLNLSLPYALNRKTVLGVSQVFSQSTNMSRDFQFKTSSVMFASYSARGLSFNLNYLIGNYDENEHIRFADRNDWDQKVSLGVSYDI